MIEPIDDSLDVSPDVSESLRKWAKNNTVPSPVRLGNKCFYDREAIEVKYWRLVRAKLQRKPRAREARGRKYNILDH